MADDDGSLLIPGFVYELRPLTSYVGSLVAFARSPLQFLRARAIPPILGAIFGFVFDLAEIISRPFDAILVALNTVGLSLSALQRATVAPVVTVFETGSDAVVRYTAWMGPVQPFVVTGIVLVVGYGTVVVAIRLARAAADSIPVVSGVETFLFG